MTEEQVIDRTERLGSRTVGPGLPVQPVDRLLIDLGLPFRVQFDQKPTPEELEQLLTLEGEKTRRIISRRYGLLGHKPMLQRDVAALEGCTRQHIQAVEARWRDKARRLLGLV